MYLCISLQMYVDGNQAVASVQKEKKIWEAKWPAPKPGDWHFLELTWNDGHGLKVYQDLRLVAQQPMADQVSSEEGTSKLFLGRANADMGDKKYLDALVDEVGRQGGRRGIQLYIYVRISMIQGSCVPSINYIRYVTCLPPEV